MNNDSYVLKILNIISLVVFFVKLAYDMFCRNMTFPSVILSSPENIMTVLIWVVTLYLWIKEYLKDALSEKIVTASDFFKNFFSVLFTIVIVVGVIVNIYIILSYRLNAMDSKDISSIGYLLILLTDTIVIFTIGLFDRMAYYDIYNRNEWSYRDGIYLGINEDILFLGTGYAWLSSYVMLVLFHAFSNVQATSILEWLCKGFFYCILCGFFEVLYILHGLIDALDIVVERIVSLM